MTTESAPLSARQPDDPYDQVIDLAKITADFLAHWRLLIAGAVAGAIVGATSTALFDGIAQLRIANRVDLAITPAVQASYRSLVADAVVRQHVIAELGREAASPVHDIAVATRIGATANIIEVLVRLPDPRLAQLAANAAAKRTVELAASQTAALNSPVKTQVAQAIASADALVAEREKDLLTFLNRPRPNSMSLAAHDEQRKLLQARLGSAEMIRNRVGDVSAPAMRDLVRPPYLLEYVDQPSAVARRASPTVKDLALRGGVSGFVIAAALLMGYWLLAAARLRANL